MGTFACLKCSRSLLGSFGAGLPRILVCSSKMADRSAKRTERWDSGTLVHVQHNYYSGTLNWPYSVQGYFGISFALANISTCCQVPSGTKKHTQMIVWSLRQWLVNFLLCNWSARFMDLFPVFFLKFQSYLLLLCHYRKMFPVYTCRLYCSKWG